MEDIVFSANRFIIGPTDGIQSPGDILDLVIGMAQMVIGPTDPFTAGQPRAIETVDEFKLRTFPREKISIS